MLLKNSVMHDYIQSVFTLKTFSQRSPRIKSRGFILLGLEQGDLFTAGVNMQRMCKACHGEMRNENRYKEK